jgi:uncharacterized protein
MRLTPLSRILLTTAVFLSLLILSGCSTALLEQRGNYLRSYQEGSLALAEQQVDAIACHTKTNHGFKLAKEASWVLLERATLRFAMGRTDEAVSDYAQALESLDYYSQTIAAEKCAQILTQDEAAAYQADDFEQVLARVYFALALLHKGDEINAFAMLRQAEEFQQEKRNFYAKVPFTKHYRLADNGLSKYLFALLLERKGDSSNANVLYQQACALILETAVQGDKMMQDIESEGKTELEHITKLVRAQAQFLPYGSRDCIISSPSTAVSRIIKSE